MTITALRAIERNRFGHFFLYCACANSRQTRVSPRFKNLLYEDIFEKYFAILFPLRETTSLSKFCYRTFERAKVIQ